MRRVFSLAPFGVVLLALGASAAPAPFPLAGVSRQTEDALGRKRVRLLLGVDRAELFVRTWIPWTVDPWQTGIRLIPRQVPPVQLEKDFARKVAQALLDERAYTPSPQLANSTYRRYIVRLWNGRESVVLQFRSPGEVFNPKEGNLVDLYFSGPDGKPVAWGRLGWFPDLKSLLKGHEGKVLQQQQNAGHLVEEMRKRLDNGH
jgi:hypothetical protein